MNAEMLCDHCRAPIMLSPLYPAFDREDVKYKTPGEDFCSKECMVKHFEEARPNGPKE